MKNRLKELRQYLQLSQLEFGKKIFVTQNHVSSLESGRRPISDRVINDICTTFGVNDKWFRTGEGEMMIDVVNQIENVDDETREMLRKIKKLNKDDRDKMVKILNAFLSE